MNLQMAIVGDEANFLNLFMKWLTRGRVVPTISASVSWLIGVVIGWGPPSLPKFARISSVRANRFSLELKSWWTRSSSTRLFRLRRCVMNRAPNAGSW